MNEQYAEPEKLLYLCIIVLLLCIIAILVWLDKKDAKIDALEKEIEKIKQFLKI